MLAAAMGIFSHNNPMIARVDPSTALAAPSLAGADVGGVSNDDEDEDDGAFSSEEGV